jgi:hypothetical protein
MSAKKILPANPNDSTKTDKAGQRIPTAYSTPRLVDLGKAHYLVQGSDLYKDVRDHDGQGYHD